MTRFTQFITMAATTLTAAAAALATPQVTFQGNIAAWGHTTNGGPFAFTPNAELAGSIQGIGLNFAGASNFLSFCVERNESLSNTPPGTVFNVTVDTYAIAGGVGGGPNDPLGNATAYLYQNFMYHTLTTAGVTYSAGVATALVTRTADAMQIAIWVLEQELTSAGALLGVVNQATVDLANDLIAEANGAGWANTGNVRILNLFDPDGGEPRQSQLVLIPLPPGSGMATAGLACLLGTGYMRRRKLRSV